MNTVTVSIEEYDQLREVRKAFEAKFGYLHWASHKFVSLNRDEQIEKLEEIHKARIEGVRVDMGREVEEYREKYMEQVEAYTGLHRRLVQVKDFHRSVYIAIALTLVLLGFILLHQDYFFSS